MPLAIVGIGIPGSGKTTLFKPLSESRDLAYINRDDIRHELLGSALDQSSNEEVWKEANRRTAEALSSGKGVVLDSTFVEKWKRTEMITFLRQAGASRVVGLYWNIPLELAKERNNKRDRVVKEEVLHWMQDKLDQDPPSIEDGFDALYTIDQLEELLAKEF